MSKIFSFPFKVPNDSTISSFTLTRFIQSFTRSFVNRSSFSSPYPYRAQLLFIVCIIIHLAFIYSSFPRPSRDHPERLCRVLIPFYLVLFTPIVLISFLLGPFCQLSPRRRLFKLCTRAYTIYIFILYTKSQISQPKSNYFC